VSSLGLILCGVATIGVILVAVVGGIVLLMRKSRSAPNSRELAYLREEVARLHKEVERLGEEVEHLKNGSRAAGSTDITGR
jgi:hypothetical protein